MTVPGRLTATLSLSVWLCTVAIGQRLDRTLVELDALALANPELAAECARLQVTIDLGPALRAEHAARRQLLSEGLRVASTGRMSLDWHLFETLEQCRESSGLEHRPCA